MVVMVLVVGLFGLVGTSISRSVGGAERVVDEEVCARGEVCSPRLCARLLGRGCSAPLGS